MSRKDRFKGLDSDGNELMVTSPDDVPVDRTIDTSVESYIKKVINGELPNHNTGNPVYDLNPQSTPAQIDGMLNHNPDNSFIDPADAIQKAQETAENYQQAKDSAEQAQAVIDAEKQQQEQAIIDEKAEALANEKLASTVKQESNTVN